MTTKNKTETEDQSPDIPKKQNKHKNRSSYDGR